MKNRIIFIFFIVYFTAICSENIFSQEKPAHPKKWHVDSAEQFYVNRLSPVYLRISTSPDEKSETVLLTSKSSEEYSNPMYFDAEGRNTVRSPWAVDTTTKKIKYPIEDIVFEVYADALPPVTYIQLEPNPVRRSGNTYYCKKGTELFFKTYDGMAGTQATYYSLDNQQFKEFSSKIILSEQKEYTVKYYSVDYCGNDEKLNTKKIKIQ